MDTNLIVSPDKSITENIDKEINQWVYLTLQLLADSVAKLTKLQLPLCCLSIVVA